MAVYDAFARFYDAIARFYDATMVDAAAKAQRLRRR
jgi:hypothetical protein